jgi:ferrous-iron efflux pump FieF
VAFSDKGKDGPSDLAGDAERKAGLMKAATYASVSVATVLIIAKLGAWAGTQSVSLLSSLIDSILDAGASLINLLAVRRALQPADHEYRFGFGKAEPLAGLAQAAFIAGSGIFLLLEAADRLVTPRAVENGTLGMIVMGGAIGLTVCLVAFQTYVVRKTASIAIAGDQVHYQADLLVNLAVIASLFISTRFAWHFADPLFAVLIVFYMAWGAVRIGRTSLEFLMDREFSAEDRARIREIVLAHPRVSEVHDMRTRSAGPNSFIQLHLEMDGDISLMQAHVVSDAVMFQVENAFPNTEVLIHQDPAGIAERRDPFDG